MMREFSSSLYTPIASGSFLKRVRTNGTELENDLTLDKEARAEMVGCLYDLYDRAVKELGQVSDFQIYNWMMDHLVIIRTSTLDQFFGGTY